MSTKERKDGLNLALPAPGTVQINPSILSADFAQLADELAIIESADIKMVHLDVMDGHFVPNITIGPPVVAKLRQHSKLFFDAHLMITDPDKYAEPFIAAGVNNITFHIEVAKDPGRLVEKLHGLGVSAGICINPETPVEAIADYVDLFDMILVMTVHPGFGGQKFMPEAAKKIIKVRKLVGPDKRVEVDGGIGPDTAGTVVEYGADTLVSGSAIFSRADRVAAINAIRNAAKKP
jgi:ribulose-phosphate 3-epimerase